MGHRAVCMKFIVLLSLLLVYFSAELQNGDACIWCYWWRFIISLFTFIPFISFVLFLALTLTFADFVCVFVCVCLFFPLHCFALALFSSIWIHFIPRFTFDSVGAFSLLLMNDDNVLLIKAHVHAYLFSFFYSLFIWNECVSMFLPSFFTFNDCLNMSILSSLFAK